MESSFCHSELVSESHYYLEDKKLRRYEGRLLSENSLSSNPPALLSSNKQPLSLSRKGRGKSASPFTLHPSLKRNAAFTLAEVLITLGIIGVVAALTLPSLISNHQKNVLVTQLKREVNVLTNGFKRILADEGIDSLCDSSIVDSCEQATGFTSKQVNINPQKFKNYFDLSLASSYKATTTMSGEVFLLADGACVFPTTGTTNTGAGMFFVDVNCNTAPNRWGMDMFILDFDEYGNMPSITENYSNNFEEMGDENVKTFCQDLKNTEPDDIGFGIFAVPLCFRAIVRNNWVFPY